MSKDQLKTEINKVLDHFSDKGLVEILNLLKTLDSHLPANSSDLLQKILKEDGHLLERFAK